MLNDLFRRSKGNTRRFQPRAFWPRLALVGLLSLVGLRSWQSTRDVGPPEQLDAATHAVERIVDGDTLLLDNRARVRLIGIDCPETANSPRGQQPLSAEATEFTRRAIGRNPVRLEFDKERVDKHGRFLAYVYYSTADRDRDSNDSKAELLLNEELVRAGLAHAKLQYNYSAAMKRRLKAAEQEARAEGRGIWSAE